MAIYDVRMPNGEILEINAPDDASEADILAFAAQNYQEAPEPEKGGGFSDVWNLGKQGVIRTLRSFTDVFGADNEASKYLQKHEDEIYDLLSAAKKQDRQRIAEIMEEAEGKGTLAEITAAFKAFAEDPSGLVAQGLGSTVPFLFGGLFGLGAKALSLMGVASGVGITKDAMFQSVKEELLKNNVSEEEANKIATEAQEYSGKNLDQLALGGFAGFLATRTGVEKALIPALSKNIGDKAAKKSVFQRAIGTGAGEFATEFGQGSLEQIASNVALQREGFDVPTFQGAVGQGLLEGIAGGVLGGGIGAIAPSRAQAAPPAPPVAPAVGTGQTLTLDDVALPETPPITPAPIPGVETPPTGLTEQSFMTPAEVRLAKQQQAAEQFGLFMPAPEVAGTDQELEAQRIASQQAAAQQFGLGQPPVEQAPSVGPAPVSPVSMAPVTPAQTPIRPAAQPIDPIARQQQAMRIDQLTRALESAPTEFDRQNIQRQINQVLGAQEQEGQQARFVDLAPMDLRTASLRRDVLRNELANAGQSSLGLEVVPHPSVPEAFAIEQRPLDIDLNIPQDQISQAEAQRRIEESALAGDLEQRTPEERGRQEVISRALRNIESRNGVASPEEAETLRQANLGQPFDRVDPSLSRQPSVDEQLTAATGIELPGAPRETIRPGLREQQNLEMAAEQDRRRQANLAGQEARDQALIEQTSQPAPAPDVDSTISALQASPAFRSAEQVATVNQAKSRLSPEDFGLVQMAAQSPAQLTLEGRNRLNELRQGPRFSLSDDVSPAAKDLSDEVRKKLLPALKKLGLGNIGLRLVDTLRDGTADGMYWKQVITIALNSNDPLATMRHEVVHALKELGAFTESEWNVLTKRARGEWINKYLGPDMVARYREQYSLDNDGDMRGFDAYIEEEAIAEAFKDFKQTKPPVGMIQNLMRRLGEMFTAIRNFFTTRGLTLEDIFLTEQVFGDIESGRMTPGRSPRRGMSAPVYSMSFSQSGQITPLTVQNARIYNSELESLVKRIGDRIAGMKSDKTIADVRKAVKKLQDYTARGLKGREWYENSAKAILDAFNGDPVLAEKLFQIIAITSANTEVAANFTKATNAWRQFAEGKPIKVGTENENKKVEALLYFGVDWDGRKTNTFYTNLMEAMEGKDSGRSTIDLHMTRMIFDQDAPTDAQYELAENMVRLLASKLDIPPRQVQAASWVTQKAKTIFEDYRRKGWKKDLNDDQLREFAFERAVTDYSHLMKAKVKQLPITESLREPSPDIRARTQTITGEVIPSVKTEMSEMEKLPYADKERLTKTIEKSQSVQNIAKLLGLSSRVRVTVGSGAYEGKVNPNLKVQLVNSNPIAAENDARDLAYAMSYVFKQDATPFFRADPDMLDRGQYGVSLKFGGNPLTPTQQKKILDVMAEQLGPDVGFSKVGPNEIVVINYRGEDGTPFLMSDEDFTLALKNARDQINSIAPIEASEGFGATSEYPYHDWKSDNSGNAIIERLYNSRPDKPNIQKGLDSLRESFVSEARGAVTRAGGQPRFALRPDQLALRPSDRGREGISFQPVQPDARSYLGSHYGNAKVSTLSGGKYGTGLRGAEKGRLDQSPDPRIRNRVYFYIPRGNDTMPPREAGVGNFVYSQRLNNILGPGPTMGRLYRESNGDSNAFESAIIDAGYDGYAVPDYGMMVVLNQDVPADYEGTVAEVSGTAPKFSLKPEAKRVVATPPFKRWFGKSKIRNDDGTPKVMYHGTARDIIQFQPKQAGAIFVTDDPNFAESFGGTSEAFMADELFNNGTQEQQKNWLLKAVENSLRVVDQDLKEGVIDKRLHKSTKDELKKIKRIIPETTLKTDIKNVPFYLETELRKILDDALPSKANIMPVYVRAENPFNYANPDHIQEISADLYPEEIEQIRFGRWTLIEADHVQKAIRDAGFDGFYVLEGGRKNLAVYNPNQIKSATGNIGTFDESGDVRYSLVASTPNQPPNIFTKTTPTNRSGKAIVDEAIENMKVIVSSENLTNARQNWVDRYSGLSQRLKDLPLYDPNGTLRADMIKHAQAQSMNLIKTGLISGVPFLNADGTIGIQRSEDNLARSEILAEQLSTNPNVVASGLTGKNYVAEIARALVGEDIKNEDARLNVLGKQQLEDAKRLYKDAKDLAKQGRMRESRQVLKQIANLRKQGYKNKNLKRELQVDQAQIDWAKKQLKLVPEVQNVLDIWRNVSDSLVNLWKDVGLLSEEQAQTYLDRTFYVPLFKAREDLNDEKFFGLAGVGSKSSTKMKQLKGSEAIRNIWENLDKQYASMVANAYENQSRRVAVQQMIGLGGAELTNSSDTRVNLRYKDNGQLQHVIVDEPNTLLAFQTFSYELSPVMKFMGGMTRALRAGALINPIFWMRQLLRDPIHATLVANSGVVTPFHAAGNFLKVIADASPEARILAERGVVGQVDSTVNLQDFLRDVGRDKVQSPNFMQRALHKLLQVHEASDTATRVSVFKRAKEIGLKKGMSEAQAIDFAVFKARESINFAIMGMSPMLNSLRQMIPFLNATIVGLDTLYRAATGYGLNAQEKAEAMRQFRIKAGVMIGFSAVYAMMYSNDDDYNRLPDYVKDNNWLIPIGTGEDRTFIKLAVPYEVGFMFKTVPEVAVRNLMGNSTGKEMLASYWGGLLHNLPTGGVPLPQALRPGIEVFTNYSFFTQRPIEGISDQGLPKAFRGDRASEFSKMLSRAGLEKLNLSPAQLDYLFQGYFAELGTFGTEMASSALNLATGKEPPAKNLHELPVVRAFMANPNSDKAVADFYEISQNAFETARAFNMLASRGRAEDTQDYISDPRNQMLIGSASSMRKIRDGMADIRKQMAVIREAEGMNPTERRDMLNQLQTMFNQLAQQGMALSNELGLR